MLSSKREPRLQIDGLYRLAMADGSILLGANFDATLDEVQAFLAAAEEAEKPSVA